MIKRERKDRINRNLIGMDGKGQVMGNITHARLLRAMKHEEVYLRNYESVSALKKTSKTYFEFYNHIRPYRTFGGRVPSKSYWGKANPGKAV